MEASRHIYEWAWPATKTFLIGRIGGQQVARIADRHRSVALQFSPYLNALTRPLGGYRKRQQQPSHVLSYIRFPMMLEL
jgi:hypothetical protein